MHTLAELLQLEIADYDPIEVSANGALLPTHPGIWRALPTADLPVLAAAWAQTEEAQLSGWSAMDCLHLLANLRGLAEHVCENNLQVAQATLI
ncbi:MAG: hypothetical protein KC912_10175 [Proteobacteria bacterium]|nr:hypothetical protein [Pseudomonadota bacterium]